MNSLLMLLYHTFTTCMHVSILTIKSHMAQQADHVMTMESLLNIDNDVNKLMFYTWVSSYNTWTLDWMYHGLYHALMIV